MARSRFEAKWPRARRRGAGICRYFKPLRRRAGPFWSNPCGTSKWLPSRTERRLQRQPAFAACLSARYVRHLDASTAPVMGPDPKLPARTI
ncbi:hypothetical protein FA702_18450 (plasmid) [Novosphingobium sp. EMRT-2]|nr:hypothetical protein FA702_18450 [Novosphingobium sp. EMRT-2]